MMRAFGGKIFLLIFIEVVCFTVFVVPSFAQNKALATNRDYLDIIAYYRYLKPDSARFFVKEGLKKAEAEDDFLGKAALLNQYGMIEDNATNTEKSREKYLAAEKLFRAYKDDIGLATVLIRLAGVERKKGSYGKSLSYVMSALKISEKNNDKKGILEARVALAQSYYLLGDSGRTMYNLRIAEEIEKELPVSNISLDMFIHFAAVYNKLNKPDSAIIYAQRGLFKSNKPEYNGLKTTLLQVTGIAYGIKGDHQKAAQVLKQALKLATEIDNLPRQQTTLIELAKVYEKAQPDSALVYLEQALRIATQLKKNRQRITVLDKMSQIHKEKGDFAKALVLKEESSVLSEQVYYTDMRKQVFSLETAYELQKSKTKLREVTLEKTEETNRKNIVFGIAVAIGLLFAVTFVYYYKGSDLNKKLKQANNKLAASNLEKDKFFSIVAHDIRSPIASTIGVLRMIADRELDEETQIEVVNKLALHCESSLEILDKLLRWGQLQIKGVNIDIVAFHPFVNVNQNVAMLVQAARNKNISITADVSEQILVQADSNHFDFVVRNLLANAIKFTPIGGAIHLAAQIQKKNLVRFSVKDSGVGISQERINNLFKLSATGTKGTSAEEGTSLGLLICKEFIAANKGEFSVESEVGRGTTFIFTLPGFAEN